MNSPTMDELVDSIADATRTAVSALFREHTGEHFYYCVLITTGEALAPTLTAWSTEALDAAVRRSGDDVHARAELKWSYADSPYFGYGDFRPVRALFARLEPMNAADEESWARGYAFRLATMVAAMKRLDAEGLFGSGRDREKIVVNVECMPPDATNTSRARELNPPAALTEWLKEAAEGE
jgi:hypothetical protein